MVVCAPRLLCCGDFGCCLCFLSAGTHALVFHGHGFWGAGAFLIQAKWEKCKAPHSLVRCLSSTLLGVCGARRTRHVCLTQISPHWCIMVLSVHGKEWRRVFLSHPLDWSTLWSPFRNRYRAFPSLLPSTELHRTERVLFPSRWFGVCRRSVGQGARNQLT